MCLVVFVILDEQFLWLSRGQVLFWAQSRGQGRDGEVGRRQTPYKDGLWAVPVSAPVSCPVTVFKQRQFARCISG